MADKSPKKKVAIKRKAPPDLATQKAEEFIKASVYIRSRTASASRAMPSADPFSEDLDHFRRYALPRGSRTTANLNLRDQSGFHDLSVDYEMDVEYRAPGIGGWTDESIAAATSFQSTDFSVPSEVLNSYRLGWRPENTIRSRTSYIAEAIDRFGGAYAEAHLHRASKTYKKINPEKKGPRSLPYDLRAAERAVLKAHTINVFGAGRSGAGAGAAHAIKRELLALFKGQLQGVKQMGVEISEAMKATAKDHRDLLFSEIFERAQRGQSDPYGFITSPPDMTLGRMRTGNKGVGGKRDKSTRHPYSKANPWGLKGLKGVYRRQRSGGSGYSPEDVSKTKKTEHTAEILELVKKKKKKKIITYTREEPKSKFFKKVGASIWDQVTTVDDDRKKVYSIKWTSYTAAYVYKNFLVAGTSKMVGRVPLEKVLGDGIRERYLAAVKAVLTAVITSHKKPGV